jgi:DNA-binding NtrC family response regulator
VKCPKCQTIAKFPGRPKAEPEAGPPPEPLGETDEARAHVMAQARREMSSGDTPSAGRALVSLPDRAQASAMSLSLTRLGYHVDTMDDPGEAVHLMEQGLYAIVVTNRASPQMAKGESLYQRLNRLSPDSRRRVFLVLVGEDLKTGEGVQAFAQLADLAVNPKDTDSIDATLRNTVAERTRLYQTFLDVRRRHESAS